MESKWLCMVLNFSDSCLPGAVGATIESIIRLDTVPDDLAAAVIADGRKFVDCTLETVKRMAPAGCYDLKRQVIIVAAHFTFGHQ